MKILSVCPNSFAANTYLLISKNQAFVIDPSVSVSSIERLLKQNNAELVGILLTHGHFDHTVSVDTIRNKFAIPLMIHPGDAPMLTNGKINGFYDFYERECTHRPAERLIDDGDELTLGDESLKVIGTPGHSPGSVCFLCEDDLQRGDLQIVPHPANRNHTLYAAYMNREFMSAKVRSFIDFMAEKFSNYPLRHYDFE